MSALGRLVVQLALDHAEYTKGLDRSSQEALKFAYRTQRSFDQAADNVKSFATRSIAQFGAFVSAVAGIGASFKAALEFDRELVNVSTLMDTAAGSAEALGGKARELAVQFGSLPVDQVKGFYELFSAGVSDTTKATEILTAANKLAVGGATDVMTALSGLTSVMSAYGDKAGTVTDISDAFFVAAKAGKTSIGEMASEIGKVLPIAKGLNISFDELTASVSALTNAGVTTQKSITGITAILGSIAKPTSEAVKFSEQLGIEFNAAGLQAKGFAGFLNDVLDRTNGSTAALAKLFGGTQALIPMMSMAGGAGRDFAAILRDMIEKAGATEAAFNKAADSRGFKIDKLMASINSAALTLGGTLADVLAPAAEWAAIKLDKLFGAKQELSGIQKKEAELASLRKELAALSEPTSVPILNDIYSNFFPNKRQADLLAQRIEDGEEDLKRLVAAFKETTKESKITADSVDELSDVFGDGLSGKTKKARDVAQEFIDAIKKQASEAGKTAIQIKRMEAAQLGVLDAVEPYLRIIEAQAIAEEDLRISRQKQADDLRRIEQLTNSVRTKQEIYNDTVKELDDLLSKGLGMEAYNRALKDAEDQLAKSESSSLDRTRNFWDTNEQIWIQGVRNVQTSLSNGLFNVFDDGLSGMVNGVKRAVGQMIAEFASIKILQSTGIAGLLGLGSTAAMAGAGSSTGSSALDIAGMFNAGFGLPKLIGSGISGLGSLTGSGSLTAFGQAFGGDAIAAFAGGAGSIGASIGSAFSAVAAPAVALLAVDQIGRLLAGNRTTGTFADKIPVIGGFAGALFGRGPLTFQEQTLQGAVSAGGFSGALIDRYKAGGSVFKGSKTDNIILDTDTGALLNQFGDFREGGISSKLQPVADQRSKDAIEIGKLLDESFGAIASTLRNTADNLGLTTEGLDSFNAELRLVSEKGQAITQEQISAEIARISDAMIATLLPNIAELAKSGETSANTLIRLNTQFNVLQSAAQLFGNTAEQAAEKVRALGLEGQTAFLDSLGGVENAAAEIQQFYDTVFTDAQKLDVTKTRILDVLQPLGVDFIPTLEQLYSAVQSGNPQLIKAALQVDGLVVEFNQLAESLNPATDAIAEQNNVLRERDSLELRLLQTQGDTAALRMRELDALEPANRSILERIFNLEDEKTAAERVASQRLSLEAQLLQLQGNTAALRQRELDALEPVNRSILENIFALQDQKAATDAAAQAAERATSQRFSLETQLLQLQGDTAELRRRELGALDPANRSILERIFALQDEKQKSDELKRSLGESMSAFDRFVSAERSNIEAHFGTLMQAVDDSIRDASSSVSGLQSVVGGLQSDINKIAGISISDAQTRIRAEINAARSGNIIDLDRIRDAITTISARDDSGFSTREEFERARGRDAGLLIDLNDVAMSQLSAAESSLSLLESQKSLLEQQLENEITALAKISDNTRSQVDAILGVDTTINKLLGGKSPFVASIQSMAQSIISIAKASKADDGIPRFAAGGLHFGGLRIVGERGPELEYTGPSRIISNSDLNKISGQQIIVNGAQKEDIEKLLIVAREISESTRKAADLLTRVTRDGESLATSAA